MASKALKRMLFGILLTLLKRMMSKAVSESSKNKKGRRYNDSVLLDFALSIWNFGRPHTYEHTRSSMITCRGFSLLVPFSLNFACLKNTFEVLHFLWEMRSPNMPSVLGSTMRFQTAEPFFESRTQRNKLRNLLGNTCLGRV